MSFAAGCLGLKCSLLRREEVQKRVRTKASNSVSKFMINSIGIDFISKFIRWSGYNKVC